MELPFAESWKIKMVEPIRKSTRAEREQWLKEAKNNVFMLKSEHVYIDCITDSGTGSMSDRQWAAMMMGDESYAGASSFFRLKDTITAITGFEYVIPTHQGRAAENVLFSHLVKQGDIIPGNSHFDTTKGHIESRKATALDCTIDEAKDTQLEIPFKGNVDPKKLEKALAENADIIPFVIETSETVLHIFHKIGILKEAIKPQYIFDPKAFGRLTSILIRIAKSYIIIPQRSHFEFAISSQCHITAREEARIIVLSDLVNQVPIYKRIHIYIFAIL